MLLVLLMFVRDGNQMADHLANLELDSNTKIQAPSFFDLNVKGRKLLNISKVHFPYIRVRKIKS